MSNAETTSRLEKALANLTDWLESAALPLWSSAGVESTTGGFHERIGQDGQPVVADNRRARVQPRQLYCFSAAHLRSLPGDWDTIVRNGLTYFEHTFRKHDGLYGALASPQGELINPDYDLYNQAFALFSFSQVAASFPDATMRMEEKAVELLRLLTTHHKHPSAGFEHSDPPSLPLCSNPHMHLFEAALAWEALAERPQVWTELADEIANLALTKFIDAQSGGLREFFDHDWNPHPSEQGRIMEPGHQFEWAWLLARWGALRNNAAAIAKAERLFEIGISYGMSADGKVAVMSLYDDFSVHDAVARMWPQTEWLKAATKLAVVGSPQKRAHYVASATQAADAFLEFLRTPVRGLWYDKRLPDGRLVDEPAPASTFYHILCAIYEARDNFDALQKAS
ncbi:AGE family epimerase/isomerase [Rhizobium sp. C4]|uniref:AGE family epimerase/isomerase n=1 Tax=Rhizobium sp. C4 TaxID=1349800 RepID=UPI001E42FB96|nr:AGE family epimerase/isomerase [Rhizobium sp. C4]MCD2173505.1 AGE family epimerase/isomerase [Rhizobium sp. C4]